MSEEIKEYIKNELKGIDPRKYFQLQEFTNHGLLTKSSEEIIKEFNYLYDRNDNPKCKPCSISRYRNSLYNTKDYWQKLIKKYNLNMEEELKKLEDMLEGKLNVDDELTTEDINAICDLNLDDDKSENVEEKVVKQEKRKKKK